MSGDLFEPLTFSHGPAMRNRLMLAPLTNGQSHPDGRLSELEHQWLVSRAQGGFGLTMTAASHVSPDGHAFAGQLGVHSDEHVDGLAALATAIRASGSLSAVQLQHGGIRSPRALVAQPVGPSDDPKSGSRALTTDEIAQVVDDFVKAASRAERARFDGVELHGAHSYLIGQFLSDRYNHRTDAYGGSPENRWRLLLELLDGIRSHCGPDVQLGLRLSTERYGLKISEVQDLCRELFARDQLDYLDLSLWDFRKLPAETEHQDRTLMAHFTGLDRGRVRLGVAGDVMTARDAHRALDDGSDFVLVGRAAILHQDFPELVRADPDFASVPLPVTPDYLAQQGISDPFVGYMRTFDGFVSAD